MQGCKGIEKVSKPQVFNDLPNNCIDICTSEVFVKNDDTNHQDVSQILKNIRIKNLQSVVIGHLNVNSYANKFDAIKVIIERNIDIVIFSETKLDASYPTSQFLIDGFSKPYRLDRNASGGGILIYVKEGIPSRDFVSFLMA